MKAAARILLHHIRSWNRNYRIWLSLLAGGGICLYNARPYLEFARQISAPIQLFEPYIILGSDIYGLLGIVICSFLFLADAPFLAENSAYEVIRAGRARWIQSRIASMVVFCFGYSICLCLFISAAAAASSGSLFPLLENDWSSAMEMLALRQPTFAILRYHLDFSYPEFILAQKQYSALLATILFNSLYMIWNGCCILALNLLVKRHLGLIVSIGTLFIGHFIWRSSFNVPLRYSLFCCASPALHEIEMLRMPSGYCFAVFAGLITLSLILCRFVEPSVEL